ncbi:MAG TPA: hypothetical protein VGX03_33930 [Candidatus Binatia bacterium]|jgi:hypothetical protein|nr:hypothetical protein [Candidatus Binatia bacterium]
MVVQIRPGADEVGVTETEMSGRKVLKDEGDIQMWQESLEDRRHGHLFRYFVGSPEGIAQSFDTPHEAWERFQSLVGKG